MRYMGAYPGVGTCPGHYGTIIAMVHISIESFKLTNLSCGITVLPYEASISARFCNRCLQSYNVADMYKTYKTKSISLQLKNITSTKCKME